MKKYKAFDPESQQADLSAKITAGLERVSQAFKTLLWDKAKLLGLSPIQIQLLIFVAHHKSGWNNVSALANEFNVTKPTISDAVKVLDKKKLILKDYSSTDNRSYTIVLSEKGKAVVKETEDFANPVGQLIANFTIDEQERFYSTLSKVIHGLHQHNILTVQRSCMSCKFYENQSQGHYCKLLETVMEKKEIRLDCPEFLEKGS